MAPKAKKVVAVQKSDGWANSLTGIGSKYRDKRLQNDFCIDDRVYDRTFQETMWEGDDMAARIVEMVPDEMMRNGFELQIKNPQPKGRDKKANVTDALGAPAAALQPPTKPPGIINTNDQTTKKLAEDVMTRVEELAIAENMLQSLYAERAYGGAAMLLGIDDGQSPDKPLDLDNIKSFSWINTLTPRELRAWKYYDNPYKPNYGKPELYQIQASGVETMSETLELTGSSKFSLVHESRLIVFPGVVVSAQHRLRRYGWGNSVFARVMQVIADFQGAYSGAAHLTVDFAQAVFKIKGLAEMMAGDNDDAVRNRALAIDMSRSLAKAILIDSEEEFERKPTPLSGLADMLMRFEHRLAAAADMPVTLLMGASPAGLNATGDSDIRFFYDRIKARQNKFLLPRIERLLRLIMLSQDGPTKGVEPEDWKVQFCSLWQLSDTEQAANRKTQADADCAYIAAGVLTPEEVAASRFGGTKYSTETVIDMEARKQMAADHEANMTEYSKTMAQVMKPPPAPAKK